MRKKSESKPVTAESPWLDEKSVERVLIEKPTLIFRSLPARQIYEMLENPNDKDVVGKRRGKCPNKRMTKALSRLHSLFRGGVYVWEGRFGNEDKLFAFFPRSYKGDKLRQSLTRFIHHLNVLKGRKLRTDIPKQSVKIETFCRSNYKRLMGRKSLDRLLRKHGIPQNLKKSETAFEIIKRFVEKKFGKDFSTDSIKKFCLG